MYLDYNGKTNVMRDVCRGDYNGAPVELAKLTTDNTTIGITVYKTLDSSLCEHKVCFGICDKARIFASMVLDSSIIYCGRNKVGAKCKIQTYTINLNNQKDSFTNIYKKSVLEPNEFEDMMSLADLLIETSQGLDAERKPFMLNNPGGFPH